MPAQYDLLIYAKGHYQPEFLTQLTGRFRRSRVLTYGRFTRKELFAAARRSRCCVYLSTDDRGPLALAEILLSGCPAIGIPTGAPFIRHGQTGILLNHFHLNDCLAAIATCHHLNRHQVSALAQQQFDTRQITKTILTSLDHARRAGIASQS